MKIIKTYSYALSEDSLGKDIDKFIRGAKSGAYQFDYKYGQEGLKTIKAYFRMIEDEFKKQNYLIARICYKKLMFLLLQNDYNYFDYEDIVGKLNFEKFIANYFTCILNLCSVEELFKEYIEYLKAKPEYDFESANKTILAGLSDNDRERFISMVEKEAENVKDGDYGLYSLIYFLLELARERKDRARYYALCDKYEKLLDEEGLKDEFDSEE
ncbi:MAG TPA: hypothetical protein HA362_01635 [Nanoarchaeota archaeon]|nr:hypothetical protein [Nanoarchaeota archaeon]